MAVLGKAGVKPEMEFRCCTCGEVFTGQDIISGRVWLTIVHIDRKTPLKSTFRCECCQDDYDEKGDNS